MAMSKKQPTTNKPYASRIELYKRSTYRKRNEKPKEALSTTLRLVKYLRDETPLVITTIILLAVQTGLSLGASYVYQNVIDGIEDGILKGFTALIFVLAFLYVSSAIISFIRWLYHEWRQSTNLKKCGSIFLRICRYFAISFFDRNRRRSDEPDYERRR